MANESSFGMTLSERIVSPITTKITLGCHPIAALPPADGYPSFNRVISITTNNSLEFSEPFNRLKRQSYAVSDEYDEFTSGLSVEKLRLIANDLLTLLREGNHVYVHCMAGISRSPTIVAAAFIISKGWSRDRALEYIAKRRPIIRPNEYFMELLDKL